MLSVKRGDTLSFLLTRTNKLGAFITGAADKFRAHIRNARDVFLAEFTVTETEESGVYLFVISADQTVLWKPGKYFFDIEYKDGNIVSSTETQELLVIKDVTYDE